MGGADASENGLYPGMFRVSKIILWGEEVHMRHLKHGFLLVVLSAALLVASFGGYFEFASFGNAEGLSGFHW